MSSPAGPAGEPAGPSAGQSAGEGLTVPENDEPAITILQRYVTEHGPCTATVDHLGRSGARIVIVAGDGRYGDAVVSSVPVAHEVCRRADVPVGEWDRALSSRISPSPADWKRMGGSGR